MAFRCRKISWMHNWDSIFFRWIWSVREHRYIACISIWFCLVWLFFSSMKFEFEDYFGIELVNAFSIMFLICRLFSFCFFLSYFVDNFFPVFSLSCFLSYFLSFSPISHLIFLFIFSNFVFFSSNIQFYIHVIQRVSFRWSIRKDVRFLFEVLLILNIVYRHDSVTIFSIQFSIWWFKSFASFFCSKY